MVIHQLLSKNLPFAAYRMPRDTQTKFLVQEQAGVKTFNLRDIENQKGFVLAPYDSYISEKAFLLEPSFWARNTLEQKQLSGFLKYLPDQQVSFPKKEKYPENKRSYLRQADALIDQMKAGRLKKVVLSRVFSQVLPSGFNLGYFFDQLATQYPNAFVYLFYLPGKGIWSGATPETLLEKQDDYFETMALAGTQKREKTDEKILWEDKEKQEQQYVSGFIEGQLRSLSVASYEKGEPETVFAGDLAHICTRFQIPYSALIGKTGEFVAALHPTPAVCGIPKEAAWKLIAKTEKHKRGFYTGFIGPWGLDETSHLFVNLRCARFFDDSLEIYVGGGLTADSIPEKEWQETSDKSQTILSVIENLRKFAP